MGGSPAAVEGGGGGGVKGRAHPPPQLWLSSNNLQGSLPFESTWVSLTNLCVLECANNPGLGGKLPKLGALPRLVVIDLTDCRLKGPLPDDWPRNLQRLLLGRNCLTGSVPRWDLPKLRRLSLSNNRLVGLKTPPELSSAADSQAASRVRSAGLKDKLRLAGKAVKSLRALQSSLGGDGTPISAGEAAKTAQAIAKARAVFGLMEALEHCELDDNAIRAPFVDLFGGRAPANLETFRCVPGQGPGQKA